LLRCDGPNHDGRQGPSGHLIAVWCARIHATARAGSEGAARGSEAWSYSRKSLPWLPARARRSALGPLALSPLASTSTRDAPRRYGTLHSRAPRAGGWEPRWARSSRGATRAPRWQVAMERAVCAPPLLLTRTRVSRALATYARARHSSRTTMACPEREETLRAGSTARVRRTLRVFHQRNALASRAVPWFRAAPLRETSGRCGGGAREGGRGEVCGIHPSQRRRSVGQLPHQLPPPPDRARVWR